MQVMRSLCIGCSESPTWLQLSWDWWRSALSELVRAISLNNIPTYRYSIKQTDQATTATSRMLSIEMVRPFDYFLRSEYLFIDPKPSCFTFNVAYVILSSIVELAFIRRSAIHCSLFDCECDFCIPSACESPLRASCQWTKSSTHCCLIRSSLWIRLLRTWDYSFVLSRSEPCLIICLGARYRSLDTDLPHNPQYTKCGGTSPVY
jgi:hypothetical protein